MTSKRNMMIRQTFLHLKCFDVLSNLRSLQLQMVDIGSLSRGRHGGVAGRGRMGRAGRLTHERGRGAE